MKTIYLLFSTIFLNISTISVCADFLFKQTYFFIPRWVKNFKSGNFTLLKIYNGQKKDLNFFKKKGKPYTFAFNSPKKKNKKYNRKKNQINSLEELQSQNFNVILVK